jgi:hypothetical protein
LYTTFVSLAMLTLTPPHPVKFPGGRKTKVPTENPGFTAEGFKYTHYFHVSPQRDTPFRKARVSELEYEAELSIGLTITISIYDMNNKK